MSLQLGGYDSGWRLPTIDELFSLVEYGQEPTAFASAFPDTPWGVSFWSSSPSGTSDRAWLIEYNGEVSEYSSAFIMSVRCVR